MDLVSVCAGCLGRACVAGGVWAVAGCGGLRVVWVSFVVGCCGIAFGFYLSRLVLVVVNWLVVGYSSVSLVWGFVLAACSVLLDLMMRWLNVCGGLGICLLWLPVDF